MQESLLSSALRTFLKAFFSFFGILLAIVPFIILLAAIFGGGESEPDSHFSIAYLPNAEGDRKVVSKSAPVILSIPIVGIVGTEGLTMHTVRNMLVESREGSLKDNRVKGVLLRIESPGGTVVDADGIYHAIKEYKKQYNVPVYAYVDGMCASGGMYIASAADKIYASPVSIVGSVGVLVPAVLNFSKLIDMIGVQSLTLTAGKWKDELNPLRPWKPGEAEAMQAIVDSFYGQFIHIVTSNRPHLDKEKLVDEYGAKIFTADKAQEYGFIDGSNLSLRDTMKLLLQEMGVTDNHYQVVQLESKSWINTLFSAEAPLLTGKIKHQLMLAPELDPALMNKMLYLYQPGM